jgi:competence protein ComEA
MQRRRALPCLLLLMCLEAARSAEPPPLELNTATQAQLERLKGVGVSLSERLLAARAQAPFADWPDLQSRVPGLGAKLARRLSDQGLTVNGASLDGGSAAAAAAASAAAR